MRRELFFLIFMSAVTQCGALEGPAPRPVLTLQAGWPEIFVGESVTLRCVIARQAGGWRYTWYRDGIAVREMYSDQLDGAEYTIRDASRYHSGDYTCQGERSFSPVHQSVRSEPVKILVSTGLVILQAPLMPLTQGEGVTLRCRVRGNPSLSQVLFYKDDKVIGSQASPVLTMAHLTEEDEGSYWCRATWGRQWNLCSARSLEVKLSVTGPAPRPVLTLQAGWPEIFVGESVTLRCVIARQAGGWRYTWYRDGIAVREMYSDQLDGAEYTIRDASRYHSGDYTCQGERSFSPVHQSVRSEPVKILVSTGLVILQAPLMPLTQGEGVTLRCRVRGNPSLSQVLFYKDDKVIGSQASPVLTMARLTEEDEGSYWCRATWGRQWNWRSARSLEVKLSVTELFSEPVLQLLSGTPVLGKSLTLRCLAQLTARKPDTVLRYYFLKEGWMLGTATSRNVFTLTAAQLRHAGSYKCKVTADGTSVVMLSNSVQVGFTADPVEEDYEESAYKPGPANLSTVYSKPTVHSYPDSPSLSPPSLPDTSIDTAHPLPDSPSLSPPSLPDTSIDTAHPLPDSPSISPPSLPDTSIHTAHPLPDSPSLSPPSLPDTSIDTAHPLPDSPSISPPSLPDTSIHTAHPLPDSPSISPPSLPDTSIHTAHPLPDSPSISPPSLPDTSIDTAHPLPDSPLIPLSTLPTPSQTPPVSLPPLSLIPLSTLPTPSQTPPVSLPPLSLIPLSTLPTPSQTPPDLSPLSP
ncbi:Fc receptor-like protein 5 [Polyodon spathula]|uniref:Fc receptor-like protein 5 n=1 Tax=Polyodon spathula TaxID=7913 RepID=UPI001B7EB454|nr:Fc receptor-like protein 5 [Polyodon spathula]